MPKRSAEMVASSIIAPVYTGLEGIAIMANVSRGTAENWRSTGILPPPIRLPNSRLLKWKVSEIQALLDEWANDPRRGLRK